MKKQAPVRNVVCVNMKLVPQAKITSSFLIKIGIFRGA